MSQEVMLIFQAIKVKKWQLDIKFWLLTIDTMNQVVIIALIDSNYTNSYIDWILVEYQRINIQL